MERDTLDTIHGLIQLQSNSTFLIEELETSVKRRSRSLALQGVALRDLIQCREGLEGKADRFRLTVEEEIRIDVGKCSMAQADFLAFYGSTLDRFERDWSTSLKTTDEVHTTWINSLSATSSTTESTALHFLDKLLTDPFAMGAGISTLESAALSSLLPQLFKSNSPSSSGSTLSSNPPTSPIELILRTVASSRGPEGVLDLVLGIWGSAISEIVGRESSSQKREFDVKGRGRVGSGSRERELENFLVGVLEVVDTLGLEIMYPSCEGTAGGPFALGGSESVFSDLLHEVRELNGTRPSTSKALLRSKYADPQSWSATVTDTLKTVGTAGIYGAVLVGGAGVSSVASVANLFYPPNSTSTSGSSSPPRPYVRKYPRASSPSQIISPLQQQSQLDSKLISAATSLLRHLTSTTTPSIATLSSLSTPRPLIEILLSRLLSQSFPLDKDEGDGHRKVLLLGVVRFFSFSWLGRKISKAGNGGGFVNQTTSCNVELISPPASRTGPQSSSILDGVYISSEESAEIFSGLHRVLYEAIVDTCGFNGKKEWGGSPAKLELAKAARTFVSSWTRRGREGMSLERGRQEIRPFLISSSQFLQLHTHFATLVTNLPAPVLSSSSPTSFKRRSSSHPPSRSSSTFSRSSSSTELDGIVHELRQRSNHGVDDSVVIFAVSTEANELQLLTSLPRFHPSTPSAEPIVQNESQSVEGARKDASQVMSADQLEIMRRGVILLIDSGYSSSSSSSLDLSSSFSSAADIAKSSGLYLTSLSFSRCLSLLNLFLHQDILGSIAEPLRQSTSSALRHVTSLQDYLMNLHSQRIGMLESVQIALSDLDELRIRAYYSSIRGCEAGITLRRDTVEDIIDPRRPYERRAQGRKKLDEFSKEEGIYDFINSGDESWYEEVLMECHRFVRALLEDLYQTTGFWQREAEVYRRLVISERMELGGSVSIDPKTTDANQSPPIPAICSTLSTSESHKRILYPFGAFSPSFDIPTSSATLVQPTTFEAHLLETTLAITSYVWSDISTKLPSPLRGRSGAALGSDSVHAIRSIMTIPLLQPLPPPADHLSSLLNTFLHHPSLIAKLHALVHIEQCMALSFEGDLEGPAISKEVSKELRQHSKASSSMSNLNSKDAAFLLRSLPSSPSSPHQLSTDNLIPRLESLLLSSSFPPNFFSILQSISSLIPSSSILDSHCMGKAFWDIALAGLSIKKDWVDDIVEEGCQRMGDGTAEGIEQARAMFLIGRVSSFFFSPLVWLLLN
jgi:hypothetical protein